MELLPVFGGALVAGLFAALGWWAQAHREHARWVREKRYEAYTRFLRVGYDLTDVWREVSEAQADAHRASAEQAQIAAELAGGVDAQQVADLGHRISALQKRVDAVSAASAARTKRVSDMSRRAIEESVPFTLLGPESVHRAADEFLNAVDSNTRYSALTKLEALMRNPLRIDYRDRGSLFRLR